MTSSQGINSAVVVAYLFAIAGVSVYFARKKKDTDQYMTGHHAIPGWAAGLSMFGSYVSAISFLANPATSYAGNWMWSAFTLITPIGLFIATTFFLKFYRRSGNVSAYTHLEGRFGPWARCYAVVTFLLMQTVRTGAILYLLAQAALPLMGGDADNLGLCRLIIVAVGLLVISNAFFGGIEAVVWAGVIQSAILVTGPLICLATLLIKTPGGMVMIVEKAAEEGKFGLGPFTWDWAVPMFWMVMIYGFLDHLRNWGVDQSFIQRYTSTSTEKEASRSIWIAGLLYMPVSFLFFFIGTALAIFYQLHPGLLPGNPAADSVFPHFIVHEIPVGLAGLVVAAVFAASMDSNLNSMATLTLVDIYKRYCRPKAGERESMLVLRVATIFWGAVAISWGILMTLKGSTHTVGFLASIGGLIAGGLLGLFLLGQLSRNVTGPTALISLIVGVATITWMTLSRVRLGNRSIWPEAWEAFRSPWHEMSAGIVGTGIIIGLGLLLTVFQRKGGGSPDESSVAAEPRARMLPKDRPCRL